MLSLLRRLLRHPPPAPQGSPAYNVGWDAHFTPGSDREDCPYARPEMAAEWRAGWDEADRSDLSAW